MQTILSRDLWKKIATLSRHAEQRQVAIAYITTDLIGLKKNDLVVTDASPNAISSNETSATLLQKLHKRGVKIYSCPGLHAKVLLLGKTAVVGSGNMSATSKRLVEAAVVSDSSAIVSGVASFIHQLTEQCEELNAATLKKLAEIKVIRRSGFGGFVPKKAEVKISKLGNRAWLVGVRELKREPPPKEQKAINAAAATLNLADPDELDWIRWTGDSRFVRECRQGDTVIQIWRASDASRPSVVNRAVPVLLKQRKDGWTRFYLGDAKGRHPDIRWGAFQRLMKKIGYQRRLGPRIEHFLEPDVENAIARNWNSAAES